MGERICLVVDDEPSIRTYISVVLRQRGIRSLEAGNTIEALRIVKELNGRIDLLITDIQMPGDMDGIDLVYSVKSSYSTLPVLVISGFVEKAPRGLAVIRKPFVPGVILEAVDKALLPANTESSH
jgi:CheY-like chemotaxis protein